MRYFERGEGRPIVFVHGIMTNANLWRSVVPALADAGFRCLAPDLPLGAHEIPMRADADLIADFLAALDLRDVVLLPSDCLEYFFPPIFRPLRFVARIPDSMLVLAALSRVRRLRPLPFVFGWVVKRPLPDDIVRSYVWQLGKSAGARRDLRKLLRAVHRRHTLAAASRSRGFERPVLLLWGSEERLFPIRFAHRLAAMLPDACVVEVADTYTFIAEDRPAEAVRHVVEFAGVMAD